MKEAYYFSHDSNARHDPKILSMRSVYGSEGYGWYWIIIEMLREQDNFKIEITKYVWNALAMQTQCNADAMHSFVEDCINEFKLFSSDGEFFWSESLNRRMEIKSDKSEKARKAAEARWKKSSNSKDSAKAEPKQSDGNADALQTHSDRNAIKESKVKESKENKNKEKESKKEISPKFETCDMEMAQQLFSLMLENNPNVKKPDFNNWANEIRLMRERDNRTEDQIRYLIDWTQSDSFWKGNILSPAKLRKQFDQLAIKVREDIRKKNHTAKAKPKAYQSLEDWADEA